MGSDGTPLEERKLKEAAFHDSLRKVEGDAHVADTRWTPEMEGTIASNELWANMKYYSIERRSREFVLKNLRRFAKDKKVLDYCCGNGEDSIVMGKAGAKSVTGIDISSVSIENCRALAERNGLDNCEFKIADAENTGFADDTFDFISEYGCLHHLELDKAYRELARILKPGGKVICNEALIHNPVIHLYRKLTPKLRTEWEVEHILGRREILRAYRFFNRVDIHLFHLFDLGAVPFRRLPGFGGILAALEVLDAVVLRLPLVKWWAWQVVFVLSDPKKKPADG